MEYVTLKSAKLSLQCRHFETERLQWGHDIVSIAERTQQQNLSVWTLTQQGVISRCLASEESSHILAEDWIRQIETGTL